MQDTTGKTVIRVLCLEDNETDRELLEAGLAADGLVCELVHAKNRQEFEAALTQYTFDLIISDFTLPGYDGMTALAAARKAQEQTPFIFVSGTIGEERAIESLKNGATDYVLKDRRDRFVSSVRRALRETQERVQRKQLEDQLRQAQKMEAIGQLAGGVAHDFNNLLAVILVNAELALMDDHKLDAGVRENLAEITGAAERAASLTRQLLAFGRKQAMMPQLVNLIDVVNNLTKMLKRIIGEDIHLDYAHDAHTPFVQADVSMMEQVLLNLVVNARDAMPHGGQLLISTKKLSVDSKYIQSNPEAHPGEFVCLRVRNSGCGMTPEILSRIFEPFFTTKEVGKGTGLGLATVFGIVKQHNGWIRVSSKVGVGTVFGIFLPAIDPPAPTLIVRQAEPVTRTAHETILLVEDEQGVRLMTRRLLEKLGYQVIEAASGREALELWQSHEAMIDLVLTDVVMPGGLTGRDLAEELRKHRPLLKMIFVSGYSLSAIGNDSDFLKRENNYFLQKPYQSKLLTETLRYCFGERQTPAN